MGAKPLGVLSLSENAVLATSYEDDYFIRGNAHILNGVLDMAADEVIDFVIDMSAAQGKTVITAPFAINSSEEEVTVQFFEGITHSGGTEQDLVNPNRSDGKELSTVITEGGTVTDTGEELTIHAAFGSSGFLGAGAPAGGASRPFKFDNTQKYLIRLTNQSGTGATRLEYDFVIFEI